jgi:flagella basal body P-ring formation protein FlgA
MEINQPLAPGEIIRERHLRKAKLIRRNDPVRLVSRGSAFQIEATGIALQDGYFGDRIKVSNSESNRTLVGSVIDKSTVEIPVD